MSAHTCLKCNVELEPGFVPEATAGGFFATVWHPGEASQEKMTWLQKLASPGGVRYEHENVKEIEAHRCPQCGRLELFAHRSPEPG